MFAPESAASLRALSAALGETQLVRLVLKLGAAHVGGPLSVGEQALVAAASDGQDETFMAPEPSAASVAHLRDAVLTGKDPLGSAFCALRPVTVRRRAGAVYTPNDLIQPMVEWIMRHNPARVVDAGAGSGRFSLEVARRAPDVLIVAIDSDPLATLMTRAALAVIGHQNTQVLHEDYTTLQLPEVDGPTAFVGNPPYVRHHDLSRQAKAWAQTAARVSGHAISLLAGLHAYFYLATALIGRPGDVGCFVTSAEWLDVNYGAIVRQLLLGQLGAQALHVLEPGVLPFEKTATTAAITCFQIGSAPRSIRLRSVKTIEDIGSLDTGEPVARDTFVGAQRWTPLIRTSHQVPDGSIELGELCRVHRGAVTGSNAVWVTSAGQVDLPDRVLIPSITRARELFAAGSALTSTDGLRLVIDLPEDLDVFDSSDRRKIERFLEQARKAGAADGYIARHRRAWWSVGLRSPAPILATYMARRPPAFVRNLTEARHINIAHGLYPRQPLPDKALDRLAEALRATVSVVQGRTYAGGLTKFEPREMERLPVPVEFVHDGRSMGVGTVAPSRSASPVDVGTVAQ